MAVFCQNEAGRIAACLHSIAADMGGQGLITLIVNGSSDDSVAVSRRVAAGLGVELRIFSIAHGDKSHAINCFLHDRAIREDAALYFCVDGYVTIAPGSLGALAARLTTTPHALAASGVASNGRTAKHMALRAVTVGGVLQGQFHALRADFVQRIVHAGIWLPIGLYRGDGLLGSMAAHDLDPARNAWDNARIVSVGDATFEIDSLSVFRGRDWRRQFRRKVRQMRGRVENAAIKRLVPVGGYQALPRFAEDLIADYLASHEVPAVGLADRPFMALALHAHRGAQRPSEEALRVVRVA